MLSTGKLFFLACLYMYPQPPLALDLATGKWINKQHFHSHLEMQLSPAIQIQMTI